MPVFSIGDLTMKDWVLLNGSIMAKETGDLIHPNALLSGVLCTVYIM